MSHDRATTTYTTRCVLPSLCAGQVLTLGTASSTTLSSATCSGAQQAAAKRALRLIVHARAQTAVTCDGSGCGLKPGITGVSRQQDSRRRNNLCSLRCSLPCFPPRSFPHQLPLIPWSIKYTTGDTYLRLVSSSGTLIDYNDDAGRYRQSLSVSISSSRPGTQASACPWPSLVCATRTNMVARCPLNRVVLRRPPAADAVRP